MNAEILSVGTELLLGSTANTDARDLSEMLSALGINVYWHTVVGDNPGRLAECVAIAAARADLIITTGGLGPTCDDLTKQTLAQAFGLELYFDEAEAESIRSWFSGRGLPMTENNLQQAWLPKGCTVLHNDWGTAPACAFEARGVHVLMLPGPPRECNAVFRHRAMPYLRALCGGTIVSHNLHIFGEGESSVEARLRDQMNAMRNPTLAPYAKEGEMLLRVTAKAESETEAEAMLVPVIAALREQLGEIVYSVDEQGLERTVSRLLRAQGLRLAAAESCTGGMLAQRMTALRGASEVFAGGCVTYTNEAKAALLGIDPLLIAEHGAVSRPVCIAMAQRVRALLGADFGVGITGLAGPDGDGVHPVGTVYVGLDCALGSYVRALELGAGRSRVRRLAVNHALDMVRRALEGMPVEPFGFQDSI